MPSSHNALPVPAHDPSFLARAQARLRQRIAARYALLEETVRFGEVVIDFTRVADPNVVLDQVAAEEDRRERLRGTRTSGDELHLPYWAEVWDSAYGIGRYLATSATTTTTTTDEARRSLSVLDLGCGMGLTGTVADALGHRVLFADLETPALLFAKLNSLPWESRVRFRQLNWQRDRLDETFDLILGADILYERKQWDHLEPFWRTHLSPNGRVLIGEPGRQTGDLFQPWIKERGWSLELRTQALPERAKTIRLFELSSNVGR